MDRQEGDSFGHRAGVFRADSAGKPARRVCAILGLHLYNFASSWLACHKDRVLQWQGRRSWLPSIGAPMLLDQQLPQALAASVGL